MISVDRRLHAICLLLVVGLAGHGAEIVTENPPFRPWDDAAISPGWHDLLPGWLPVLAAGLLVATAAALLVLRSRGAALAVAITYVIHHLTWPLRVRNHMALLLAVYALLIIGWAAAGWPRDRRQRSITDGLLVEGIAILLVLTYLSAAFHKLNTEFLSDHGFGAVALRDFLRAGGLHGAPALAASAWAVVATELVMPLVAWRSARLRPLAVLALFVFHFPMLSSMGVSDYPMIVAALYPAWFTPDEWRFLAMRLAAPRRGLLVAAAIAMLADAWFVRHWGLTTGFGLIVAAMWGYAVLPLLALRRRRGTANRVGPCYHGS
jgi:hypothetical protein